jgi:hypothetical protein
MSFRAYLELTNGRAPASANLPRAFSIQSGALMHDGFSPAPMAPSDQLERYVSVDEIAPIVGMSVSWLNKHRRENLRHLSPPFIRIGTRCLYPVRACLAWLAVRQ